MVESQDVGRERIPVAGPLNIGGDPILPHVCRQNWSKETVIAILHTVSPPPLRN